MSACQILSAQPGLTAELSYSQAQIDLIWAMGLASLKSNNDELVLPQTIEASLTQTQVDDLKQRLSRYIGAPTIAFVDQQAQVFRIIPIPALKNSENSLMHSPAPSSSSPESSTAMKASTPISTATVPAIKAKVRRPPNAFILYRQERHPALKLEHPEYHNNDISVVLGQRWKSEPDRVKAHYKKLADEIKAKHKQEHPDYQYAPRKPSEKKRRMIAHRPTQPGNDEDMFEGLPPAVADVHEILGTSRPKQLNQFAKDSDGNIGFTLPTHNTLDFHDMINAHNKYFATAGLAFNPTNQYQLSPSIPAYVQNDQDFVDSLVDWNGIATDLALIRHASVEEMAQLAGVDIGEGKKGNSYVWLC